MVTIAKKNVLNTSEIVKIMLFLVFTRKEMGMVIVNIY